MKNTELKIEVEIETNEEKKTIEMISKESQEIYECDENKVVMLTLKDGQIYTGVFKGVDDGCDEIMLKALKGNGMIGLEVKWLSAYFEQVDS